ncbi:MAG: alpha-1,2-fucosyltransferase [Candidatus Saccharimonadales bacterium]
MIVTLLKGGLGNQMFQYAAGRRLALKHGTKLFMDLSWFKNVAQVDTKRVYELNCFNIEENFIDRSSIVIAEAEQSLKVKVYRLTKGLLKPRLRTFIEKAHHYDKQVLSLPDNTYLDGFWQNEKYFTDIRRTLFDDFTFKSKPDSKNKQLLEAITNSNAVSLHIRRGDYARNQATKDFHGLMGSDYYNKAVEIMAKKTKNPRFFIFSDEPDWTKKNIKIKYPATYVSGNKAGFEDMRLMVNCRHHITANSSFSWWGAWLNPSKDKIVIAPRRWFLDPSMSKAEIIPEKWIKL